MICASVPEGQSRRWAKTRVARRRSMIGSEISPIESQKRDDAGGRGQAARLRRSRRTQGRRAAVRTLARWCRAGPRHAAALKDQPMKVKNGTASSVSST